MKCKHGVLYEHPTDFCEICLREAMRGESVTNFETELEHLINRYSLENGSNTPDFILAEYLRDCLRVWDKSIAAREKWYGVELRPGGG